MQGNGAVEVNIVVRSTDDALLRRLRAVGVDVRTVLPTIGVVAGVVTPDRLDEIAGLDGVSSVERSGPVSALPDRPTGTG